MKKLFIAIIISFLSLSAFADQWSEIIPIQKKQMMGHYNTILHSPKFSPAQKQWLVSSQQQWGQMVDSQCRNNRCVSEAIQDRSGYLAIQIAKRK